MQKSQINRPTKLNIDKARKFLTPDEAFYLLNQETGATIGNDKENNSGEKTKPLPANYPACRVHNPVGETYTTGEYYSAITNEAYAWNYNSNGAHYISRIGEHGCQIVADDCIEVSADPKHAIKQWRAFLRVEKVCPNRGGKSLIWTDGSDVPIGCVDVEASIETESFRTPFFERCVNRCELFELCVPDPCGCIHAEYVPLPIQDIGLPNFILDKGLKFSYRHVYYDGRASIWANPSSLYYLSSKACFDSKEGFSRCLRLNIPIGNPMVDKIEIAFSTDSGKTWMLAEILEKYAPYTNDQQKWYERDLAPAITSSYNSENCTFEFLFCDQGQCLTIAPDEINQVYNPIPRGAQGILPVADLLGFYNFKKGACPLNTQETSKMRISTECEAQNSCAKEYVTITVRTVIHNTAHNSNQFIYREGDGTGDDLAQQAWFGGIQPSGSGGWEQGYDQFFNGKTRNFIVGIEGTGYWAEMKQYRSEKFWTNRSPSGIVTGIGNGTVRHGLGLLTNMGWFYYQEAKIKVEKGTKGFLRLYSHHAQGFEPDTSTFTWGVLRDIRGYQGRTTLNDSNFEFNQKEIYVEACDGDVELFNAFVVHDMAVDTGLANRASGYFGYVKDEDGRPIGFAQVVDSDNTNNVRAETDWNGFYFFYLNPGRDDAITKELFAEVNAGGFGRLKTLSLQGEHGRNTENNITVLNTDYPPYATAYADVRIKVIDCLGNAVPGVHIAMRGEKYSVTDGSGTAKFRMRNNRPRDRRAHAIIMDGAGCIDADCMGGCSPCLPDISQDLPESFTDKPFVALPTLKINQESLVSTSGLKHGGRYAWGVVVKWSCGKIGMAHLHYTDIPKSQDTGGFRFCKLSYDGTGMKLDDSVECVDIVRSSNLNPYHLQWRVDKVERTSSGKIKLTIQTLNDYNESYFFRTNTIYQWKESDRVEFIRNGDNKLFSSAQFGNLNLLTLSPFHDKLVSGKETADANYFNQLLINDDDRLSGLTEGAIIELQSPRECQEEPTYFTICATIPVVNGRLQIEKGDFHTFDTFLVSRQISNFAPQIFEHHSPSDFWGDRMSDEGRPFVLDKYALEKRAGRDITFAAHQQFNSFGSLHKTFDAPEQGDIVAMNIRDGQIVLGICEHDNFLAQAANDLLRVDNTGQVRAVPSDAIISKAQPKVRGEFGCKYHQIGGILFGDGFATWVDGRTQQYIQHDYSQAVAVSNEITQSYFIRRCQEMESHNRKQTDFLNHLRFVTGQSSKSGHIYLTTKTLRNSGIYNHAEAYKQENDTIGYNPKKGEWLGFFSFTPESYCNFIHFDENGCSFITYLQAQPYIHPIIAKKYNEFYGVAVDRVVGIALNDHPEKEKQALAFELQSRSRWYVKKVTSDDPNYLSEIPPIRVKQNMDKCNAEFLANINSRGGLYGNDFARSYALSITFIRDNTDALKYNTTDNAKRVAYDELDLILVKYFFNEQSGFNANS